MNRIHGFEVVAVLAWVTLEACNGSHPARDAADGEADLADEWERRFPEQQACRRDEVIPAVRLDDWSDTMAYDYLGHVQSYAQFCQAEGTLYLLYVADPHMAGGPFCRVRTVGADGSLGAPRSVDISGIFGGEGFVPLAIGCKDGRFRLAVDAGKEWASDPELSTTEDFSVMYLVEVNPVAAAVVGAPHYLNGRGRQRLDFLAAAAAYFFEADRLFFEGAPPVVDPHIFFVGEVDLAWDGVWDRDWYSRTRWLEPYDPGMFPELFSFRIAPPPGERIVFGWAGGAISGPKSAVIQVGRRTGNDEERGQFEREIVLEQLLRASYPDSGFIQLSVGSRSIAVVHDEWAQLFDFELNQIGHPVNFGTLTDSTHRTSVLYAGGYHAILQYGCAGLPPEGDVVGGGADLAVSWIDEDARFIERTVLWCPTDGLPNPLPLDAVLMGSAWTGTGYWMVFEASEVYGDPYGLYVLFLPAP